MNRNRVFAGISLITMSVLMLELSLTRLFSATMYYHFAFMAISLALFGSGASGVFIYIVQSRLIPERTGKWLSLASQLFAVTTVFALYVILTHPLSAGLNAEGFYTLTIIYAATALPFFFAGCVVTLAITRFATCVSRLYLFDLAGAATGCVLLIPAFNLIGAINTVLLVSVIAAAAAVLFNAPTSRLAAGGSLFSVAALAIILVYNIGTHRLDIRVAKGNGETDVVFSKWNSFSRITVHGNPDSDALWIRIDADAATPITKGASRRSIQEARLNYISALAYHIRAPASALIIGPGGGDDVMAALASGTKSITGVEINPIIAQGIMSSEPFKSFSGDLYQQPQVRIIVDEGRSFIRRSAERYDIIQATLVDTWAATGAGAFTLTENNLYTVEAFKDYLNHLTDEGVLTMTRWYFQPPDQTLRLLTISRAAMKELGIQNPARHVALIVEALGREGAPATFLLKKSEFTDDELGAIESVAARNNFVVLYTPRTRPPNMFTRIMEAGDPAAVWAFFETNIEPTYDNNPFFFNTVRWAKLSSLRGSVGEWRKNNLGIFVLFSLFAITFTLVVLFILVPLVLVRKQDLATGGPAKMSYLLYFASLGAGFIIVEVAMIQKFILFLGHPVFALSVVLFSLLSFSALGSYLSGRLLQEPDIHSLVKLLAAIPVVIALYILILPPIFYGLVHLSLPVRILISILLMGPLATLMGMPMPLGIRLVASSAPELIPWGWGVNGATSVMGSVGTLVIAISRGFNQTLVLGAIVYLIALLFIVRSQKITAPEMASSS